MSDMPFRGLHENKMCFLENAMNSLSEHPMLSEFISTHCM